MKSSNIKFFTELPVIDDVLHAALAGERRGVQWPMTLCSTTLMAYSPTESWTLVVGSGLGEEVEQSRTVNKHQQNPGSKSDSSSHLSYLHSWTEHRMLRTICVSKWHCF